MEKLKSANKPNEGFVPDGFDQILTAYLNGSDQLIDLVLSASLERDPEQYADIVALVKTGQLVPQIAVQAGMLKITLFDVETRNSIGDLFTCVVPVLEARGMPN